jgi:hypothetical protein
MGVKTNRTLFLRGNYSEHHNTELETWKHVTWQHEPHSDKQKKGANSSAPEECVVPAPLVALIVLLSLQTRW